MLLIRFIDRFTFCMATTGINKGRVTLMWPAGLSSGLAALGCGRPVLWRNLLTLITVKSEKKKTFNNKININGSVRAYNSQLILTETEGEYQGYSCSVLCLGRAIAIEALPCLRAITIFRHLILQMWTAQQTRQLYCLLIYSSSLVHSPSVLQGYYNWSVRVNCSVKSL